MLLCRGHLPRQHTIAAFAAIIVSFVACTSANRPVSTQEDMVAVSRMLVTLDRLAADGDLDEFLTYVSDDAVFMPPDEPAIIGKTQIGAWYESLYEGFHLEMSHEPLETDVFGRLIIHRGNATGMLEPKDGAAPKAFDNKYLFVIRKDADGSLKIWRAVYNANQRKDG